MGVAVRETVARIDIGSASRGRHNDRLVEGTIRGTVTTRRVHGALFSRTPPSVRVTGRVIDIGPTILLVALNAFEKFLASRSLPLRELRDRTELLSTVSTRSALLNSRWYMMGKWGI